MPWRANVRFSTTRHSRRCYRTVIGPLPTNRQLGNFSDQCLSQCRPANIFGRGRLCAFSQQRRMRISGPADSAFRSAEPFARICAPSRRGRAKSSGIALVWGGREWGRLGGLSWRPRPYRPSGKQTPVAPVPADPSQRPSARVVRFRPKTDSLKCHLFRPKASHVPSTETGPDPHSTKPPRPRPRPSHGEPGTVPILRRRARLCDDHHEMSISALTVSGVTVAARAWASVAARDSPDAILCCGI